MTKIYTRNALPLMSLRLVQRIAAIGYATWTTAAHLSEWAHGRGQAFEAAASLAKVKRPSWFP